MLFRITTIAMLALACALPPTMAAAQQSQDYFVPSQQRPAQAQPQRPRQAQQPPAPEPSPAEQVGPGAEQEPPIPQYPLPPVPQLPALPKGNSPPAAVMGVIGVPEVMRASTSAQQVERVIGERRSKLNEDAQKEQAVWRDMQQALATHRNTMSPEQIRGKERELQERITNAQRQFRDRNRIIQEAAQVALNQIQSALIAVIRQVAESHGMNLVFHRQQVALNVAEFDITDQVTQELNKVLPSVTIPPDGVEPQAQTAIPVPIQPAAAAAPTPPGPAAPSPAAKKP